MVHFAFFYILLVISYLCSIAIFAESTHARITPLLLGLLSCILYTFYFDNTDNTLIIHLSSILSVFFSLHCSLHERVQKLFFSFLTVNCFMGLAECFMTISIKESFIVSSSVQFMEPLIICSLFLIVMLIIKKKTARFVFDIQSTIIHSNKVFAIYYAVVILLSITMLFVVAGFRIAYKQSEFLIYHPVFMCLIIFAYLAIGGIAFIYMSASDADKTIKEMLQQQVIMNTMQDQYYKALLAKENDTTAFRHDMKNHMMALTHLADEKDLPAIKDYIVSIQGAFSPEEKKLVSSGNALFDTLSSYYLKQLPSPGMMQVTGKITDNVPGDLFRLTTIFTNLLQNAVEAVLNDPREDDEKYININVSSGRSTFRLIVENTYYKGKKKKYLSNESNEMLHGYGLSNVSRAVSELNGSYEVEQTNNVYIAKVTLYSS